MREKKQYWAFVSYSSKDKRWGQWLRWRLENYPIPKDFRGLEVFDGAVLGKNLRPVFRDRDELAGSSNLGESIRAALDASRFLVVLCSKNSAKSLWVNKEIEDFQALGKGDRILALILNGVPNATAAGNPAEECFPPALRYPKEPIAGDLRKEGDGKARGFLKILAGISQVGFDDLYRRHERAMARKRMVAGVVAITLIAAFASLSIFAWSQKVDKQKNLEAASNADLASALKVWQEDFDAQQKGEQAIGFHGKSRWHEAVVLLARSLERNPDNQRAALWLHDTIRHQGASRRDWPSITLSHKDLVRIASFSSDGTRVVTASANIARVWDSASGQPIGNPMEHSDLITSACFSPDGSRIVTTSSDKSARLWDTTTGQPVGESLVHDKEIYHAAFSSDGMRVATASADRTARIWCASTGKPLGEWLHHDRSVSHVCFSPEGTQLITAGIDGKVIVWDAASSTPIGTPLIHEYSVSFACFSPDGRRLLTLCGLYTHSKGYAQLWDRQTGRPIGEPFCRDTWTQDACFSPDGSRLATASRDKTARIWDAETGKAIGNPYYHSKEVVCVEFTPDGSRIVTACCDNAARVWNLYNGALVGEPLRHQDVVVCAQFSPDGTRILTASMDKTACLWPLPACVSIGEPFRHGSVLPVSAISPCGKYIAIEASNNVRIWDTTSLRSIGESIRHQDMVESVMFSPDGTRIVTASRDETACIWDLATGSPVGKPLKHRSWITSANFSPDGSKVVTASRDWTARIWDAFTGEPIGYPMTHKDEVYSARYSPDGLLIVTASRDGTARMWNASSGTPVGHPLTHRGTVGNAVFSPNSKRVVTASQDTTAQLWDAVTGLSIGNPMRHADSVSDAIFSPNGEKIVTWSQDQIYIWDASDGRSLAEPIHQKEVTSTPIINAVTFNPDGKVFITASFDGLARIWDISSGKPVGEPLRHNEGSVRAAYFSPDGLRVLTVSDLTPSRLWDANMHPPAIVSLVLNWATGVAGLRYSSDGDLEDIPWAERIELLSNTDELPPEWRALAEWVLDTQPGRSSHVTSRFTLRQIAERERDFNGVGTIDSLTSALEYDYTLPLTRLLLANALEAENATKKPEEKDATIPARAAHLRRYDLDRLLEDPILWIRAAKALLDAPVGAMVGIGPKALPARAVALPIAEKAVALLKDEKPNPAHMNLAHAYLFNNQFEKAKAIYAKYLGTVFEDGRKWNDELRNDFKLLREAGHDHPDMTKIETLVDANEQNID